MLYLTHHKWQPRQQERLFIAVIFPTFQTRNIKKETKHKRQKGAIEGVLVLLCFFFFKCAVKYDGWFVT